MKTIKQIERIKILLARLERGEVVTNNSLARVLSEEEMLSLKVEWNSELTSREVEKPREIKEYEKLLKIGLLLNSRLEPMLSRGGNAYKISKMSNKAENALEAALERLTEMLSANSELGEWLDRDIKDVSLGPVGMARIIGSRSSYSKSSLKNPYPASSKRDIKTRALEASLARLTGHKEETFDEMIENGIIFKVDSKKRKKNLDLTGFKY